MMAVIVSISMLAIIFNQVRNIRREDKIGRMRDVLADAQLNDPGAFLEALQNRALTSGALILDADSLGDFDAAFRNHLIRKGIIASQDIDQISDPQLAEQFAWFFRKFAASHAMLVSDNPLRIMALNVPTLAQSKQLKQELRIAQRIAILLAEREAPHD